MKNLYKNSMVAAVLILISATFSIAQTTISGKVTDGASSEPIAGVNIVVKGTVSGTISNTSGEFNLNSKDTRL